MAFVAPKVVLTPLLIASASLAGRRWGALTSGWLLALPLTSVLTTFAHRIGGRPHARAVLRGLLIGLPGFATFFLVVATLLPNLGAWLAFGLALGLASGLNVTTFLAETRRHR